MTGQDWNAIDAHEARTLEALFEDDSGRLASFSSNSAVCISTGRKRTWMRTC